MVPISSISHSTTSPAWRENMPNIANTFAVQVIYSTSLLILSIVVTASTSIEASLSHMQDLNKAATCLEPDWRSTEAANSWRSPCQYHVTRLECHKPEQTRKVYTIHVHTFPLESLTWLHIVAYICAYQVDNLWQTMQDRLHRNSMEKEISNGANQLSIHVLYMVLMDDAQKLQGKASGQQYNFYES